MYREFVKKILKDDRGKIIICNILDSVKEGIVDKLCISRYFDWWFGLCTFLKFRTMETVLNSMDLLIRPNELPPKFRSDQSSPTFIFTCYPRYQSAPEQLAMVVPALLLSWVLDKKDKDRLIAKGVRFPINDKLDWTDKAINALMNLPPTEQRGSLGLEKTLGKDIIWFTQGEKLIKALTGHINSADRARDILGLLHCQPSKVLVTIYFSSSIMRNIQGGRPTFMDAGSHLRFKTRAQTTKCRRLKTWGHTLDLMKLAMASGTLDGLPERVSAPIPRNLLTPNGEIKFAPLGRVTVERGCESSDDHKAYARVLMERRSEADLESAMMEILR